MAVILKTSREVEVALAAKFKAKRLAENLTQAGLSSRSGVSLGTLKRFEKIGEISLKSLLQLAMALGCLDEFDALLSSTSKPTTLFGETQPSKRQRGTIK